MDDNIIRTYQELVDNEYIKMTIGMPGMIKRMSLKLNLKSVKRWHTNVFHQSLVERERR